MNPQVTLPDRSYADKRALVWGFVSRRSFRVVTLVALIGVMSIVDLYLTLLYVTNTGMMEMNPFARAMMEYQSPAILSLWKAATLVLNLGILLMIRTKRSAEIGAWIEFCVLGWLMIHWVGFIEFADESPTRIVEAADPLDPSWIMMEADAGFGNIVIP